MKLRPSRMYKKDVYFATKVSEASLECMVDEGKPAGQRLRCALKGEAGGTACGGEATRQPSTCGKESAWTRMLRTWTVYKNKIFIALGLSGGSLPGVPVKAAQETTNNANH